MATDQKISQKNSLTKSTVATNDVLPVVDTSASETKKMTYQELMQPQDSNFRVAGSSDNTKLLAFEVDGLTTGTTRTVTIPDVNGNMVLDSATQTLTAKTLTSPQINFGSDANGDLIIRNGSGVTSRLAAGTSGQILNIDSVTGLPAWVANPSGSNADTTTKGVVEIATTAEITAGTATGGTGAALVVPASAVGTAGASKLVQYDSSGKYPAADGSQITKITSQISVTSPAVTVGNTAVETSLVSVSIPGGTLGTTGAIRVRMHITNFTTDNASPQTCAFLFKYGATTLATLGAISPVSSATSVDGGFIEAVLTANASTGAQRGSLLLMTMAILSANSGQNTPNGFGAGSATEDSTAAKTLAITAQWSGANANSTITVNSIIIEKI